LHISIFAIARHVNNYIDASSAGFTFVTSDFLCWWTYFNKVKTELNFFIVYHGSSKPQIPLWFDTEFPDFFDKFIDIFAVEQAHENIVYRQRDRFAREPAFCCNIFVIHGEWT
jgi:hypothetical protein